VAKKSWNERFFESYIQEVNRNLPDTQRWKIGAAIAASCQAVGIAAPLAGKLAGRLASLIEDHAAALVKARAKATTGDSVSGPGVQDVKHASR